MSLNYPIQIKASNLSFQRQKILQQSFLNYFSSASDLCIDDCFFLILSLLFQSCLVFSSLFFASYFFSSCLLVSSVLLISSFLLFFFFSSLHFQLCVIYILPLSFLIVCSLSVLSHFGLLSSQLCLFSSCFFYYYYCFILSLVFQFLSCFIISFFFIFLSFLSVSFQLRSLLHPSLFSYPVFSFYSL